MAKPKPSEELKLFHFRMQPSLIEKVRANCKQYKTTASIIEAIKEWLDRKEQLKQTINSK